MSTAAPHLKPPQPLPDTQRALALSREEHAEEERAEVDRVARWHRDLDDCVARQQRELQAVMGPPSRALSGSHRPFPPAYGSGGSGGHIPRSRSLNDGGTMRASVPAPLPFEDPVFTMPVAEPGPRSPQSTAAARGYQDGSAEENEESVFLQVTVSSTDQIIEMVFPRSSTIHEVKARISAQTGIEPDRQSFFGFPIDLTPRDDHRLTHLTRPGDAVVQLLLVDGSPPASPTPNADDMDDAALAAGFGGAMGEDDAALAATLAATLAGSLSPLQRRVGAHYMSGHTFGRSAASDVEEALIGDGEEDIVPAVNDPPLLLASGEAAGGGAGFARAFLTRHPHAPLFVEGTLAEAIAEARRQQRPLVLCFHDDRCASSWKFERMLCHAEVVSVIQMYFVAWGHDVTHVEQRRQLFASTRNEIGLADGLTGDFPCLAIVGPVGSTFQMTKCLHEFDSAEDMTQQLESEGVMLLANMTLQPGSDHRSVERRDLLDEQDAAYRASLEADRRKEVERKEQAEAEAKAQAITVAREAEEEERVAAAAAQAEAEAEAAAARLHEEPSEDDASAYRVRFQLPGGRSENRRFPGHARVNDLFLYVASLGYPPSEYSLRDPVSRSAVDEAEQGRALDSMFGSLTRVKLVVEEKGG